jgi:formiminotetrahydrofolate cyclodeaminase
VTFSQQYILRYWFSYDEKTQETQAAKQLKLQDDSVFATHVPLSNNTACAAFTSTPERAHQKSNITVADVSEISASEHEIGRM